MRYQNSPGWISGSRSEPVHRWYFITEGLSVELVRAVLKNARGDLLEPFQGCGTALLEANKLGRHAVGLDVNPFMCFASSVKNRFYDLSSERLKDLEEGIVVPETLANIEIPRTLQRYYSTHAIQVIRKVKACIDDMKASSTAAIISDIGRPTASMSVRERNRNSLELVGIRANLKTLPT